MVKVVIKEIATDKIVKEMECANMRMAIAIERGVNINLNHEKHYTEIKEGRNKKKTHTHTQKKVRKIDTFVLLSAFQFFHDQLTLSSIEEILSNGTYIVDISS